MRCSMRSGRKARSKITDPVSHKIVQPMPTIDDVAKFYAKYGVKAEDFVGTANSFAVNAKIKRADAQVKAYGVDSTPTIIVNGKYRLTARNRRRLGQGAARS